MATGRGTRLKFGPGELFVNPSDLSGTTGTGLGFTAPGSGITVMPGLSITPIDTDERGAEKLKSIYAGCDWALAAELINWDAGLAAAFPGLVSGTKVLYNNNVKLGTEIAPVKLLYVPDDATNEDAVYFRKAVVHVEATARLRINLGKTPDPTKLPVVFNNMSAQDGVPATSVQIARLADIVL